jgi:hypothetical protein
MRSVRFLTLLGLAGLIAAGCGDDSTSPGAGAEDQLDQQAIGQLMTGATDYFDGGQALSDDRVMVENTTGKLTPQGAPIESFYFIREITGRDVHREILIDREGERPIATVSSEIDLTGVFHLFYDDPENVYLPGVLDKPLAAVARHGARFVRRLDAERHRGWRLVAVSGSEILSEPTTKDIVSLEIISNSVNLTIDDPLVLVRLPDLPTFQPGEEVTLRVTTTDADDYVFLHTGFLKSEFRPLGNGVFEGTWRVGERQGRRHVGVDVIDADTLFDDQAPYDSAMWVLHYRVAGEAPEDFEG